MLPAQATHYPGNVSPFIFRAQQLCLPLSLPSSLGALPPSDVSVMGRTNAFRGATLFLMEPKLMVHLPLI